MRNAHVVHEKAWRYMPLYTVVGVFFLSIRAVATRNKLLLLGVFVLSPCYSSAHTSWCATRARFVIYPPLFIPLDFCLFNGRADGKLLRLHGGVSNGASGPLFRRMPISGKASRGRANARTAVDKQG